MIKTLLTLLAFCLIAPNLWAQPANDDCANAIAIVSSSNIIFDTSEATEAGPDLPEDCETAGSTGAVIFKDIWYAYTQEFPGMAEFSLCGTANFDTRVAAYTLDGCPTNNDNLIGCNDDGAGCQANTSKLVFDVTAGETYLLRLGGWADGEPDEGTSGTGTFSVGEFEPSEAPANNLCDDAIILDLGPLDSIVVEYTTINATTDGNLINAPFECFEEGEKFVYNSVWYKFTPSFTGAVELSNCGLANYDSRFSVYGPNSGCYPPQEDMVGCSDDGIDEFGQNCGSFTSRDIFLVEEGSEYIIEMGGFNGGSSGTGNFLLKRTIPPVPPANDACADADSVFVMSLQQADDFDFTFDGFNLNSEFEPNPNPVCNDDGKFIDVWYRFNSGNNTELELRFNIVTGGADFVVDLFSACGQLDTTETAFCFRTDTDPEQTFYDGLIINGLPGVPTEYLLRVSTRITANAPGEFWFQLVGEPFVPSSVRELKLDNFSFTPNPVTDRAQVRFALTTPESITYIVTNTLGQTLYRSTPQRATLGEQRFEIQTEQLAPGVYFLNIATPTAAKTVRFVKQ